MIDVSGYTIIKNAQCIEDIICLSNLLVCELIKDLELESSKEFFEKLGDEGCANCPICWKCLACIISI